MIVPTFDDCARMSDTDIVLGWSSTSWYSVPPTSIDWYTPSTTVSGVTSPSWMAPDIVMTLFVDPGSYTSVTGRLFSVAGATCAGLLISGAVDRRHREHVPGLDIHDHRGAALRVHRGDALQQSLLGVPLQRLVEGEHQILPALRRLHLPLSARDVVALRVAFDLHAAGRAGEQLLVPVLHAAQAVVVGADEADHRAGDRARRVEPSRLRLVRDADEVELAYLRRRRIVHLPRDVRERALAVRQALDQRGLVDLDDRCELGGVRDGIVDDARIGHDGRLRHRHRQHLAAAIEDVAALGGNRDRPNPLSETE